MAKFIHGRMEECVAVIKLKDDGKTACLNGGGVHVSHVATQVQIECEDGTTHEYRSQRAVIEAPDGAKLLPYFSRANVWYVVMVEQFRIALPGKTLEPAGGEAGEIHIRHAMARELEEEAHIRVEAKDIDIVFGAYIQPSMMRAKAYGGIVKIEESQLPKEIVGGEWQFGEFTVVAVHPLLDLLKDRDAGKLELDLETHLLLDGVAKAVDLLVKRY